MIGFIFIFYTNKAHTKAYNVGTSAVVVLQTNIMLMCICNASSIANFLFIVFFYFADRPTLFFSPICMRNIKNNNDALIIRTDLCCNCVFVIPRLSKVITSANNPDEGANPVRPLGVYWILLIMLDIRQMDLSCVYYVKSGLDLC